MLMESPMVGQDRTSFKGPGNDRASTFCHCARLHRLATLTMSLPTPLSTLVDQFGEFQALLRS